MLAASVICSWSSWRFRSWSWWCHCCYVAVLGINCRSLKPGLVVSSLAPASLSTGFVADPLTLCKAIRSRPLGQYFPASGRSCLSWGDQPGPAAARAASWAALPPSQLSTTQHHCSDWIACSWSAAQAPSSPSGFWASHRPASCSLPLCPASASGLALSGRDGAVSSGARILTSTGPAEPVPAGTASSISLDYLQSHCSWV